MNFLGLVLMCSSAPGWPGTHCVAHDDPELLTLLPQLPKYCGCTYALWFHYFHCLFKQGVAYSVNIQNQISRKPLKEYFLQEEDDFPDHSSASSMPLRAVVGTSDTSPHLSMS